MKRRIRKKHLARYDAMIAEGVRLYATRPTGDAYEEAARGLLELQIGVALWHRFRTAAGPRRGWGVSPPQELVVERTDAHTLRARGTILLYPPGDRAEVIETFHLRAKRTGRGWRSVLLTFGLPEAVEQRTV